MRTEYFLFVHHATSILAKLNTWCFEHCGDISSCSLLVNPSQWTGNQILRTFDQFLGCPFTLDWRNLQPRNSYMKPLLILNDYS